MKSHPKWRLSKIRLRRVSTQNCSVLLTLLSLALVELLLSFPFSVFLHLDLDLVMLCSKFPTKIALTANSNTRTGNDLFSHNASTKSARNLTANQQKGGSAQGCKFHGWHSHQDVAYKNITRSLMTKSLGFQPESILPQVNTEQPRVIRKFQGYMTFETSYCEWRSAISISRFSFLFYDISHLLPFRRVGTIFCLREARDYAKKTHWHWVILRTESWINFYALSVCDRLLIQYKVDYFPICSSHVFLRVR